MTIILDDLDKRRSYLCLETGRSAISKQIQRLTKQFVDEGLKDKVPSHIFMLVYEKPDWVIYESHMTPRKAEHIPSGVRRYPAMYPFVLDVLQRSTAFPVTSAKGKCMPSELDKTCTKEKNIESAENCLEKY